MVRVAESVLVTRLRTMARDPHHPRDPPDTDNRYPVLGLATSCRTSAAYNCDDPDHQPRNPPTESKRLAVRAVAPTRARGTDPTPRDPPVGRWQWPKALDLAMQRMSLESVADANMFSMQPRDAGF